MYYNCETGKIRLQLVKEQAEKLDIYNRYIKRPEAKTCYTCAHYRRLKTKRYFVCDAIDSRMSDYDMGYFRPPADFGCNWYVCN